MMLKRLAILAVLGTLATIGILTSQAAPLSAPKQRIEKPDSSQSGQQQATAQNNDQSSPKAPSVVVQVGTVGNANSADSREDLQIQRELALFTALLVVVGFLQAWLLKTHGHHLHTIAGVADKQTDHMVASERAWVGVSKVTLTSGAIDHPDGRSQVFVSCGAENYGKTPARILGMNVLLAKGPINDPEKSWNEKLYNSDGQTTTKWIIVPSIPKHLYGSIQGFFANPDDELPIPDVGEAYFIHGVIRYWDVFSEMDKFTRFCFREDRVGSLLGKGWHVAGGERCNQET
jgi:hypothetical protein